MEIWLDEWCDEEIEYQTILLHIPGTDIWIGDTGYSQEHLEAINFTQMYWDEEAFGDRAQLTKIGKL